uniref:Uncharacterized protein n=1 Tax=Rhizophora mucronata TaxID=61149 RepID=A0A2P2NL09_RHIMU
MVQVQAMVIIMEILSRNMLMLSELPRNYSMCRHVKSLRMYYPVLGR